MSEIGPDGAALLAQVLPVGILIVAVERQALGGGRYPKRLPLQILWWARFAVAGLGTGAAVLATALCVVAAVADAPLAPVGVVCVVFGGYSVGAMAAYTTVRLALKPLVDSAFDK